MRTARFSDSMRGLLTHTSRQTPLDSDPLDRNPHGQKPFLDRDPLEGTWDQRQRPLTPEGTWDQAARQEVTSYRDPPLEQNDLHTLLKTLRCPKLRLLAVKTVKIMKAYFFTPQTYNCYRIEPEPPQREQTQSLSCPL